MDLETVRIIVNGETKQVPPGQNVADLLALLKVPAERVAVELNRSIVRKRDWEQTAIAEGSHLEIVEFVGGG